MKKVMLLAGLLCLQHLVAMDKNTVDKKPVLIPSKYGIALANPSNKPDDLIMFNLSPLVEMAGEKTSFIKSQELYQHGGPFRKKRKRKYTKTTNSEPQFTFAFRDARMQELNSAIEGAVKVAKALKELKDAIKDIDIFKIIAYLAHQNKCDLNECEKPNPESWLEEIQNDTKNLMVKTKNLENLICIFNSELESYMVMKSLIKDEQITNALIKNKQKEREFFNFISKANDSNICNNSENLLDDSANKVEQDFSDLSLLEKIGPDLDDPNIMNAGDLHKDNVSNSPIDLALWKLPSRANEKVDSNAPKN